MSFNSCKIIAGELFSFNIVKDHKTVSCWRWDRIIDSNRCDLKTAPPKEIFQILTFTATAIKEKNLSFRFCRNPGARLVVLRK